MQLRGQWSNISKILKEKNQRPRILYSGKLSKMKAHTKFSDIQKLKEFLKLEIKVFRQTKAGRINHQQTYIIKNNKIRLSLVGRRKMVPNGKMDLHKE